MSVFKRKTTHGETQEYHYRFMKGGHIIDDFFNLTGGELGNDIFDAIDNSEGFSKLVKFYNSSLKDKEKKHICYMLDVNELLARAYSQYITTKSKDEILISQLNLQRKAYKLMSGLWDDEDFVPIFEAFDKTLTKIGLIK